MKKIPFVFPVLLLLFYMKVWSQSQEVFINEIVELKEGFL